jgi:murein DD-endopeptidase MepM/ murein hydrolase activator NlpD
MVNQTRQTQPVLRFLESPFSSPIALPAEYEVYDFTQGYDANRVLKHPFGIGRYAEKRPTLYKDHALFHTAQASVRDIHMGIDIGAPLGTPVVSFWDGEIFDQKHHPAAGDYGSTIITKHQLTLVGSQETRTLYALHGHLSLASLQAHPLGASLIKGTVLGWVGDRHENGGWNPHLHFQLSWKEPQGCDLPGAVNDAQLEQGLKDYPDPRCILGMLYAD